MGELRLREHPKITVLVAGDFMLDRYLYSSVSRISPEAPVPVARVMRTEEKLGGAGNVALNIRALGSGVKVLTCIGEDETARLLLSGLTEAGVDISCICRDPLRKTSRKTRIVAQNQQLLRCDEEEAADVGQTFCQYLEEQAEAIFSGVDAVILSDYGKGVLTPAVCRFLIRQAKARKVPVLVDPKGADYQKYTGATVCTPNLKELTEAGGMAALETEEEIRETALSLCRETGLAYLLATRSEKGLSLIDGERGTKQDFPAVAQEVCDVTGAGDTVISAFALCMVAGYPLEDCCRLANIAASVVVSKFGAGTATVEEIRRVIALRGERSGRRKVCSREEAADYVRQAQRSGKRVVFTNGCFDLVHAGHIASFCQARAQGDILVVGVNDDDSVRRMKGDRRPVVALENRMRLLEALEPVDCVVPFPEDTPQALIEALRPDVLVKGKDWEGKEVAGADFLREHGGRVVFIDLEEGLSTTAIVEKIRAGSR